MSSGIDGVDLRGTFSIERRTGVPIRRLNSSVRDENRFGVVKVPQLKRLGSTQLINGSISRWRVQADRVTLQADGWRAERMGFSNDPFTPSQTRIDAEGVVARDLANGDLLITAQRNRLIVEEQLPIPVSRRQLIQEEEEVKNRWVVGIDNDDRDGLFVGRTLKPIGIGSNTELSLEPQLMLQRAIDAGSGSSPDAAGDLFGLEAKLLGRYGDYRLRADADISSFSGVDFLDNSRYWGSFGRSFDLGWLGDVKANLFGTHRYRTWNGSLGSTDIQAAYGLYGEKRGAWEQGASRHSYLVRGAVGDYNAEGFDEDGLRQSGRSSLFGSVTSTIPPLERPPGGVDTPGRVSLLTGCCRAWHQPEHQSQRHCSVLRKRRSAAEHQLQRRTHPDARHLQQTLFQLHPTVCDRRGNPAQRGQPV